MTIAAEATRGLRDAVLATRAAERRASRERRGMIAAAARGGATQAAIADAIGSSQPEVNRLLRDSSARDAAGLPRRWMTARVAAAEVERALRGGDELMAFKMIIQARDHLRTLADAEDVAEWSVEPPRIRDPRFDTLLRRVAAAEFGREAPAWTEAEPLREPWIVARPRNARRVLEEGDPQLRALNIFMMAEELTTA